MKLDNKVIIINFRRQSWNYSESVIRTWLTCLWKVKIFSSRPNETISKIIYLTSLIFFVIITQKNVFVYFALLLLVYFQGQPAAVFYKKRCSQKFLLQTAASHFCFILVYYTNLNYYCIDFGCFVKYYGKQMLCCKMLFQFSWKTTVPTLENIYFPLNFSNDIFFFLLFINIFSKYRLSYLYISIYNIYIYYILYIYI